MNQLSTSQPSASARPLLSVEQVSFRYGGTEALREVSFAVNGGDFHALLGPNGAGKSTLFALVSRLFDLQQGAIRIDGASLQHSPAAVLHQIGMVFQQSTLDLDLTVEENLLYHGALHGIGRRACRLRLRQELARLQMEDAARTRVRHLNGGHRRRVEIARALLHNPRLLLLDEPTVGLDSHTRTSLNRHVRELCREKGVGVLWATHLIEEVQPEDPVIILHRGQVRAHDRAGALCRTGGFRDLPQAFERLTEEAPDDEVMH